VIGGKSGCESGGVIGGVVGGEANGNVMGLYDGEVGPGIHGGDSCVRGYDSLASKLEPLLLLHDGLLPPSSDEPEVLLPPSPSRPRRPPAGSM
jgi:hypothetical protein